jgi:glycosyltransferase involved in cell wall biosynthesis
MGYECQQAKDFELIIADDGSRSDTKDVIDAFISRSPMNIRHIYQEDKGFRKCRVLNKALSQSKGDYIIVSDGDCIPRADFVATHLLQRNQGQYLSGGYCKLLLETSRKISDELIANQQCFSLSWLKDNGFGINKTYLKLFQNSTYAKVMNFLTPAACNLKGANASFWKKDAITINGFNEDMAWGGEDREFGIRLQNIGIKAKHVRYNAVCLHLYHGRPYKDDAVVQKNKAIRIASEKNKVIYTQNGIDKLTNQD